VYNWRRREEMNRDMSIAWYMAALSRADKLPKLETLLMTERSRQSLAEMRQVMKQLSAQYRIPLKERVH
jgi:hypothetical protein